MLVPLRKTACVANNRAGSSCHRLRNITSIDLHVCQRSSKLIFMASVSSPIFDTVRLDPWHYQFRFPSLSVCSLAIGPYVAPLRTPWL